jgi:hypothetical protein
MDYHKSKTKDGCSNNKHKIQASLWIIVRSRQAFPSADFDVLHSRKPYFMGRRDWRESAVLFDAL